MADYHIKYREWPGPMTDYQVESSGKSIPNPVEAPKAEKKTLAEKLTDLIFKK